MPELWPPSVLPLPFPHSDAWNLSPRPPPPLLHPYLKCPMPSPGTCWEGNKSQRWPPFDVFWVEAEGIIDLGARQDRVTGFYLPGYPSLGREWCLICQSQFCSLPWVSQGEWTGMMEVGCGGGITSGSGHTDGLWWVAKILMRQITPVEEEGPVKTRSNLPDGPLFLPGKPFSGHCGHL